MKFNKGIIIFILMVLAGLFVINHVIVWEDEKKSTEYLTNITLPDGYTVKAALKGLRNPTSFAIDKDGNIYIAENINNRGRVVKYTKDGIFSLVVDCLKNPISYIMLHKDQLYISQKGAISKLTENGIVDLTIGLPSVGDYSNNAIAYGYDGMLYICQGSATNSGVVGIDNMNNGWLAEYPFFHDYPPYDCILSGTNFRTENPLSINKNNVANTGAYMPFNTNSLKSEAIKGRLPGTACVLRLSSYGNIEDAYVWGVRNPMGILILPDTRVFLSVQGMEERGSRPIANGCDYLYEVKKKQWLGWPDYEGGEPVTMKKFKSKNQNRPVKYLMELHPDLNPQKPIVTFKESGRIGYIGLDSSNEFGYKGTIFIPLKKGKKEQAEIVAFNIKTNKQTKFMQNKEGSEAFHNPLQCIINKEKLYILEGDHGTLLQVQKQNEDNKKLLPEALSIEYFIVVIIVAFVLYLLVVFIKKRV